MKELEEKYINLLLNKCLNITSHKSLFISYNDLVKEFANNIKLTAERLGIKDIYLCNDQDYEKRDILKTINKEDIKNNPIFNNAIWDEYAKKGACFLLIDSEIPHLMEGISEDLVVEAMHVSRTTKPIYKEKQMKNEIPWCIAAFPNKEWAKDLFKGLSEEESYNKLFYLICDMCMINKDTDPIDNWNKFFLRQQELTEKLNNMHIKKLHYQNSLNTDLEIELNDNTIWTSCANDKNMIANMPSYEVFTSPNYKKTNGIVHSSKPLIYNGTVIDKFYLKFKDGKCIESSATIGDKVLKNIINTDEYSPYLGEVALVNYDSPISNTNQVFNTTLFDENASCHLALGSGFHECLKDGLNMNDDELRKNGVNVSSTHVDFMIGTSDLSIIAETANGQVQIFKNGNFCI